MSSRLGGTADVPGCGHDPRRLHSRVTRGRAGHLPVRGWKLEHGNPGRSARRGAGPTAETSDRLSWGRSRRSSRSAGKPRTGRRAAGRCRVPTKEETGRWTPVARLMKAGSSTFNGNSTSGARATPTKRTGTCGTGSQIHATSGAPGVASPPTSGNARPASTGKPGKYRPLGIPTVKDRVVQSAVLDIIEPVFEADFAHTSYGFRPGRGCHGALEHIRRAIQPMRRGEDGRRTTPPYQWAIEGDIKGCFDHIDHHLLMDRIRLRIRDRKVTRLITSFLKAGVLEDMSYLRTDAGTPQGGIISPLLCNVALSVIEQHYARWVDRNREAGASRHVDGVR